MTPAQVQVVLNVLSTVQHTALELAAVNSISCPFCGQTPRGWCRINPAKFEYQLHPHMARKFAWLEQFESADEALDVSSGPYGLSDD
jgi:hypothetical protein